jgi:hypothetical protein
MRRLLVSIVAVEKKVANIMSKCIISCLIQYANTFSTSYLIAICRLSRSTIILHVITKTTGFSEKKVLNIKCV